MAERAHPDQRGFKKNFFGLIPNSYRENLFERYLFCNKYIRQKRVLDIPCGMGWGTSLLKGYEFCLGMDIDSKSIKEANGRYSNKKLTFKEGNLVNIELDDCSIDVVICLEGFEHITFLEGQTFLTEAKRILKDEGKLIISTPLLVQGRYHSGNKYHLCEYKRNELFYVIKRNGFKIETEKTFVTKEKSKMLILVLINDK